MYETTETKQNIYSISSSVFKRLHWTYLIAYLLVTTGDNLPSAYRYAIFESYNFSRSTIEILNVISYASALLFGTFSVSLGDRFGRRAICLICGFCFIISYITYNFSLIWILVIGQIFWGIGNAIHATGFEAWLIQEHRDKGLDMLSLQRILRNSYIMPAFIAMCSSVFAQFLVKFGGFSLPYNISILLFVSFIFFLWEFWTENYGIQHANALAAFPIAFRVLLVDPRIVILGMCSSLFEASLFIFVIEWTPTFRQIKDVYGLHSLPLGLGVIFAMMWFFDMIGVFIFELLSKNIRAQSYMIVVFLMSAMVLILPVIAPYSFALILTGFLLYEICIGIYRPSMGLLRSLYYPDEVRLTIMNYMRVPQLIFMLIILLSHFKLRTVWIICLCFNLVAMLLMIILRRLELPKERVHVGEAQVLLDNMSTPSFIIKKPQPSIESMKSSNNN